MYIVMKLMPLCTEVCASLVSSKVIYHLTEAGIGVGGFFFYAIWFSYHKSKIIHHVTVKVSAP